MEDNQINIASIKQVEEQVKKMSASARASAETAQEIGESWGLNGIGLSKYATFHKSNLSKLVIDNKDIFVNKE
jgi:hypothetical protein